MKYLLILVTLVSSFSATITNQFPVQFNTNSYSVKPNGLNYNVGEITGHFIQVSTNIITPTGTASTRKMEDRLNDVVNLLDYSVILNGESTLGLQSALNSTTNGKSLFIPTGIYYITNHIDITNSNIKIFGGGTIAANIGIDNTIELIRLYGTNLVFEDIIFDGKNRIGRGITHQANIGNIDYSNVKFYNFTIISSLLTTPYGVRPSEGNFNINFDRCIFRHITNMTATASAVGIHVTAIAGGGATPKGINIFNSWFEDIGPIGDGDGIRFQNDFQGNLGYHIAGNTFTNCYKRGVKIMVDGGIVENNWFYNCGYAAISGYGNNALFRNNFITNQFGDMGMELGSPTGSYSNIVAINNTIYRDLASDITGTGDGIRAGVTNGNSFIIANNNIYHARIAIFADGGLNNSSIYRNYIDGVRTDGIRVTSRTVGTNTFYPNGIDVSFNKFRNVTNIPVSIISGANYSVNNNQSFDNQLVALFTSATNYVKWLNFSSGGSDISSTQFAIDSIGNPVIKNAALLTNIFINGLTLQGGTAFSGLATNNFGLPGILVNRSNGTNASAYFYVENDLANYADFGIYSSLFSGRTNEGFLSLSSGLSKFRFDAPSITQSWNYHVGGTNWFTVDGAGPKGLSHPYSSLWNNSLRLATEDDIYDKIESIVAGGSTNSTILVNGASVIGPNFTNSATVTFNVAGATNISATASGAGTSVYVNGTNISGINLKNGTNTVWSIDTTNAMVNVSKVWDATGVTTDSGRIKYLPKLVTTTDATPTSLYSLSLVSGQTYFITLQVVIYLNGFGGRGYTFNQQFCVLWTGTGDAIIAPNPATPEQYSVRDATSTTASDFISVSVNSSASFDVTVTGIAATTFNFAGMLTYFRTEP